MDVETWLARHDYLVTTTEARELGLSRHALDWRVRQQGWRRILRTVYATPAATMADDALRRRAALRQAGARAALTSLSALAEYGIAVQQSPQVHLAVPTGRTSNTEVVFHRRRDVASRRVNGVVVVPLPEAVVAAFPLLKDNDEKHVLCVTVVQRGVRPAQLRSAVSRAGMFRGRRVLLCWLALVEAGCHSPIEIDYVLYVERRFGLPEAHRQVRLSVAGRPAYGDVYYDAERVLVELDGRDDHSSDVDRRADLRRDAELASETGHPHAAVHGSRRADAAAVGRRGRSGRPAGTWWRRQVQRWPVKLTGLAGLARAFPGFAGPTRVGEGRRRC